MAIDRTGRVTRSAIRGSDPHLLHGLITDTRVGCTFGHEFAGVVFGPARWACSP